MLKEFTAQLNERGPAGGTRGAVSPASMRAIYWSMAVYCG